MNLANEFAVVLSVTSQDGNLVLRIDNTPENQLKISNDSICQISFINCERIEEVFEFFQRNIGDYLWELDFDEIRREVEVYFDSGDFTTFKCDEFIENYSEYSRDDIWLKFQLLSQNLERTAENGRFGWSKYGKLRQILEREVGKEFDRWQRKLEFFKENKPERLIEAEASLKAYEKVLNLMKQAETESK